MALLGAHIAVIDGNMATGQSKARQTFDLFALENVVVNGRLLSSSLQSSFLSSDPRQQYPHPLQQE